MRYSEEDKIKYVRGFRNCTLTMYDYAEKMGIPGEEFRGWLKKYKELPSFGMIELNLTTDNEVMQTGTSSDEIKTIMAFDNGTIKLELKENFSRELLKNLVEALVQC